MPWRHGAYRMGAGGMPVARRAVLDEERGEVNPRLTLRLPLSLKRALAYAAADRGVPLAAVVEEALRQHPDVSNHVERIMREGG